MILRDIFSALRSRLMIGGIIAAVLVAAALWAVVGFLRPLPPRTVTMATGPEGGAYRVSRGGTYPRYLFSTRTREHGDWVPGR